MERAWRARAQIRDPAVLDPWLRRIVVREVVRRQMSRWRRLVRPATPIDLYPMVVVGIGPDLRIQLLEALARLSAPQRAVIVLHHYAGYRIEEVSAMVGAPIETVRSRLRLGMAALRAGLLP
jgi:RNA polymerase sigma-70 factor (ECF subfamily)